jgi:hypothetical protein
MNTSDWVGSAGVFLILLAYFCHTFRWLSSQSRLFFMMNTIGASMACLASFMIFYWPFVILEATWAIVSLIGLIRVSQSNRR